MTFLNFQLRPELFKALDSIRFVHPTEIQSKVIPLALKNRDIIGMSQTGSGKTHAYLLPIFNKIDESDNRVQAVIIVPTRELAVQVFSMAKPIADAFANVRIALLSGGFERTRQIESIASNPHIIIGTPGRIKDIAFQQHAFKITSADTLVLDEADMTLEAGFLEDVNTIAGQMKRDLQMLAFSATMPKDLRNFLDKYMKNPILINVNKATPNPTGVEHIAYPTRNKDRFQVLETLLSGINPFMALIFVTEKKHIDDLHQKMSQQGFNVGVLHGDLDPTTRRVMLKRMKKHDFQYVIVSDIAARGLDIEGISHIINYNLPFEQEFYFHRAGRTARAGQTGACYTLYDKEDIPKLENYIEKGVVFLNKEFKDGEWVSLKPLTNKARTKRAHPKSEEINKVIRKASKQPVKPGYKKKMRQEIDKIKRKHRREVIEKDIKKRIVERAIERTKTQKMQSGDE